MVNYQADNIKTLDYFEHIRQYPGMYIGSKDLKGLHHCAKEIVSNSIDEYLNGAGDTITVILQKDGGLFIKDNARGIPHGTHESGCSILQACYGIANTGGKFNNATGESGYNTSGGEHGTGGKAVNALSTKMVVTTAREGLKEIVEFSRGQFISHRTESSQEQGVSVLFYPDSEIFETIEFDSSQLKIMLKEFSFLCTGLTFIYIDEKANTQDTFLSKEGLRDYIDYLARDQKLLIDPICFSEQEGSFQVEIAISYISSYSPLIKLYTNNIPQEKGTHLTGFKTAFTTCINTYAREKGWIKEKESNLTGSDLEEGQLLIINFRMVDPVFKGQNKEELTSSEGRTYVQRLTTQALKDWLSYNEKTIKPIIDKALNARKAREAARKARDSARNIKSKKESGLRAKVSSGSKFIDCGNRRSSERNLVIVEGVSAASAVVEARNPKTDAIYLLIGKIASPLRTDLTKLLASTEVVDLTKHIGAGFGNDFDTSKIAYDKVIIATDQDSDGFHIELELLTLFFTYMRPLIESGHVYRAVTPLYLIRDGKKETYCWTEDEYQEWKKNNGKGEVTRAKGLGALEAKDLKAICFDNQRYKRITISDAKKAETLLNVLMGGSADARKQYIYENAERLGFNFD